MCVRVGGCGGSFSVGIIDAFDVQIACAQCWTGPCQGNEWEGGGNDWHGACILVCGGAGGGGGNAKQCEESCGIGGDGAGDQLPGSDGMHRRIRERWCNGD